MRNYRCGVNAVGEWSHCCPLWRHLVECIVMTFKMALPMGMRFLLSSIAFISINSCCLGLYDDAFHEELFIKPLPTGHIYTHFQFTTTWDVELKRKDECKTIRGIAWPWPGCDRGGRV